MLILYKDYKNCSSEMFEISGMFINQNWKYMQYKTEIIVLRLEIEKGLSSV